jgi:RNA polymerase sigma factor (TIGR02999 family)
LVAIQLLRIEANACCASMSDVTRILSQIEAGDPAAAEQLLPLIYDELRKLAAAKLAQEKPGNTLQATALVHEAWLRLVGPANQNSFDNRGHFFAAAAEAMRRILTDAARRKMTTRHGGEQARSDLPIDAISADSIADPAETLAVHELLDRLAEQHPRKAQVVKLRYFVGCTEAEAAQILGIHRPLPADPQPKSRGQRGRESFAPLNSP